MRGEPPEETAARELGEEVGYKAGRLTKIAECYSTPGFCDEKLHIYLAEDLTPVQASGDDDEDLEVVRLTRAELQEHLQTRAIPRRQDDHRNSTSAAAEAGLPKRI